MITRKISAILIGKRKEAYKMLKSKELLYSILLCGEHVDAHIEKSCGFTLQGRGITVERK